MRRFLSIVLTLMMAFAVACSSSGGRRVTRPATIDEFLYTYVASMNAHDLGANRALWHSKSFACITPDSSVFYDRAFKVSSRHAIPADYKFTAKPIGPNEKLAFEGYAIYPVRPTQEVQIDYTKGMENSGSVILWLAQEGKGWAEVFPCVGPETIQEFKKDLPEINAHEQKINGLVDTLQDPLRSELLALLKEGKSSTAAGHYAEATKQDRKTAMYVIDELEYRLENTTTSK